MAPRFPMTGVSDRRSFLALSAGLLLTWSPVSRSWRPRIGRHRGGPHPEPRPGITAAKVLTAEQLGAFVDVVPIFDMVREMPQIVDGIRCQCGCSDPPDYYSLLSCYEGEGMARYCEICQGQAKLAHRLWQSGETLDGIRSAIDARFGTRS